jgi:hypothetical protein
MTNFQVNDATGIEYTRDSYKKFMQKMVVNDLKETVPDVLCLPSSLDDAA